MHEYYQKNRCKLKKEMNRYFRLIRKELEKIFSKDYGQITEEIWTIYENEMLENFPYIGGDAVSGTKNLTGVYFFVAFALAAKPYGLSTEEWGHLTTTCFERFHAQKPAFIMKMAGKLMMRFGTKMLHKKDSVNAANAAKYPGSFETKTQMPDTDYAINFHNLVFI